MKDKAAILDRAFVWHPFTQMKEWMRKDPIVIAEGKGAVLKDTQGRSYLDANASIWTNLHGHNHPVLNRALQKQLKKIAHSSALGLANLPASELAAQLVKSANQPKSNSLEKVFFSDNGSTAMEVALKLSFEVGRRRGQKKPRFLSLSGAYHGDTIGAVSLGHIDLFHQKYDRLLFKTDRVMSPYCYRCPFNKAKPERADAREYRKCQWECVDKVEKQFVQQAKKEPYAAFVVEPRMQGAAGMIPQPEGWQDKVFALAREHKTLIVADEVFTGFGRTGGNSLFATTGGKIAPDFLCLAKGMTGGYMPMAATLTTREVFSAFLGEYEEFKTFFHGHSYTANQLGSAVSLASLDLLQSKKSIVSRVALEKSLRSNLALLWDQPNVGDIRQSGLIAGVELVQDWKTRRPFDLRARTGIRVCEEMAKRGVLTRPIGNVIVLVPPYCTTPAQVEEMISALRKSIQTVLG